MIQSRILVLPIQGVNLVTRERDHASLVHRILRPGRSRAISMGERLEFTIIGTTGTRIQKP